MARYFGSAFGTIKGKINGIVGSTWRGIQVIKQLIPPTQRGTLELYRLMKEGTIPPERFSYPLFNLRRCIMGPLIKIASDNLEMWIHQVWNPLSEDKGMIMTGINLFLHQNVNTFYASMDRTLEYDPVTNFPNLKVLKVSDGELEPTTVVNGLLKTYPEYDPGTGELTLGWSTKCYKNGSADDKAWIIVAAQPLLHSYGVEGNWQAALTIPIIDISHTRGDGLPGVTLTMATGLTPANLYVYVFFSKELIFSPSQSSHVMPPAPP